MKKMIMSCLAFMIFISFGAQAKESLLRYYNDIRIGVDNTNLKSKLYNIDDQIYVPVRALAEYLRIPVIWDDSTKQVSLMTNNKEIKIGGKTDIGTEGVIPDEKTAYQIGKIILEKHCKRSLDYETEEANYYVNAVYHPYDNSWRIYQECEYKNGGGGGTGVNSPTVVLNRSTGEVTYINVDQFIE